MSEQCGSFYGEPDPSGRSHSSARTCSSLKTPKERPVTKTRRQLGDVRPDVLREYLVDERLIADTSTASLMAERLEDTRIHANGDELPRLLSDWRPAHTAHGRQLLRRRIWNIREVNPSPRTPRVRVGSRFAR